MAQEFFGIDLSSPQADYWVAFGEPVGGRLVGAVAPGRSEIAGNHTDHEGGHVVAAALKRYVRGAFGTGEGMRVRMRSAGFDPIELDLSDLAPRDDEKGTTAALIRGIAAGLKGKGLEPHGFDCSVESDVPAGSGLSSSAAIELELAQALNLLWGDGSIDAVTLARICQSAERDWFGKPCGLMDQAAVAVGGLSHMDFSDPDAPKVDRLSADFSKTGYSLALVSVGADHAANTADYAAIPEEMQAVARALGAPSGRLCEVDESLVLKKAPELRETLGDRAVLRALHYYREDRLVEARAQALEAGDMAAFLECTNLSGASSAMYLQNVSVPGSSSQPAMLALAAAQEFLGGRGAARIHGGGFGGTIQAFVRDEEAEAFCRAMNDVLAPAETGDEADDGGQVPAAAQVYEIDQEGARAAWLR